ncbi:DUF5305 family protein [Haloparvum sp. PAK95]|uniref:DUF5305 family protein n=1 Tax=Haloparvum sp. PAK95 TaxID=3418962 RepID=UPI003D2EFB9F
MSGWERVARLRGRRLVGRYGSHLVLGLLVVAVLAVAGAGLLLATPPTIDSTEERATTVVEVDTHTSAVVTEETTLYEEGTRLEDRATYLRTASPNLTVSTTATPTGAATVDQRLSLVYQAERGDDVVWSETVPLAVERTNADGGTRAQTTIDVRDVERRLQAITSEVGGAAVVRVYLRHDLTYETDAHNGERTSTAALKITQDSYSLSGGLGGPVQVTETIPTSRPAPGATDVLTVAGNEVVVTTGGVWLLGIGLLALLGSVLAERERRRNPDPQAIDRELERIQFSEWISTGRVDVGDAETYAVVDTLGDLVDVAIDSNRRVVHDRKAGRYVVAVDDSVYTFSRGGDEIESPTGAASSTTGIDGGWGEGSVASEGTDETSSTGDTADVETDAVDGVEVDAVDGVEADAVDGVDAEPAVDAEDVREDAEPTDAGTGERTDSGSADSTAGKAVDPVEQFLQTEFDDDPTVADDEKSTGGADDDSFVFPGNGD